MTIQTSFKIGDKVRSKYVYRPVFGPRAGQEIKPRPVLTVQWVSKCGTMISVTGNSHASDADLFEAFAGEA